MKHVQSGATPQHPIRVCKPNGTIRSNSPTSDAEPPCVKQVQVPDQLDNIQQSHLHKHTCVVMPTCPEGSTSIWTSAQNSHQASLETIWFWLVDDIAGLVTELVGVLLLHPADRAVQQLPGLRVVGRPAASFPAVTPPSAPRCARTPPRIRRGSGGARFVLGQYEQRHLPPASRSNQGWRTKDIVGADS